MELKIAKIKVGKLLVLPLDWEGYNFRYDGMWLKENELEKIRIEYFGKYDTTKHAKVLYGLAPFALVMTAGRLTETFGACPDKENKENMLISRGLMWDNLLEAYLLVGDILEEYEFDTIELIDDSTHDWHEKWGKI